MTFYVIKETNHSAIFNDLNSIEKFKETIKSKARIRSFDDIEQTYEYLHWNSHTKVYVGRNSQVQAIFESKKDSKNNNKSCLKPKKFNGPRSASISLYWTTSDEYSKWKYLGKSRVYTELLEYTLLFCKQFFKNHWYTIVFYIIFPIYTLIALLICIFAFLDCSFLGTTVLLIIEIFLLVLLLVLLKKYSLFLDYKTVSEVNNRIYLKIKEYNLDSLSINELINEVGEPQKSADFTTDIVIALISSIISFIFSCFPNRNLFNSHYLYIVTKTILFIVLSLPLFVIILQALKSLFTSPNFYLNKASSAELLLKQELKNVLIEKNKKTS